MTGPEPLPHQTIIVRDGRVAVVGPAGSVKVPTGARVIDGRGKYLTPGLIDGHVHILETADLPQFVAYGVTSVRNMMGSPQLLEWRRQVDQGALVGPRIVTAGPIFAGSEVRWRNKTVPASAEAARAMVRAQRDSGYDFIKIYDGLGKDAYQAAVDEARALGLRIDGHIPAAVGFAGVLAARQDLQHTDKVLVAMWGHAFDTTRIDSVVGAIRASGVTVTPTLVGMERMALIAAGQFDSLLARPDMRRMGKEAYDYACGVMASMKGNRPRAPGVRFNPWTDFQLRIVAAERRAGVPMVAGTDYPNGLLAPGSSLMAEMRALGDAGLTEYEALAAATRNASRIIGDTVSGVVATGARADLVLLGADPLAGYGAAYLDRIEGVVLAGRYLTRDELDRLAPARTEPVTCRP